MKELLESGYYLLSGIDEFHEQNDECSDREGFYIILNNNVYVIEYDSSDGYRSYVGVYKSNIPTSKVKFKFPPQLVDVHKVYNCETDEDGFDIQYHGIDIFDANNGKCVFSVGTDSRECYYPVSRLIYIPENLSINQNR